MSGRSIGLSGLYYFAPSDSFEPFVKLGVSAWNAQAKFSAFQYDNAGVLTTIAGATDFSKDKVSDTNVMYGVGVDGKINDTIKYRVALKTPCKGRVFLWQIKYLYLETIEHTNTNIIKGVFVI
jgi:hypothetical protein